MPAPGDDTRSWRIAGILALAVIVLAIPLYVVKEKTRNASDVTPDSAEATFVGREQCMDCHADAYDRWAGSDHDNAMAVATDETVLGDFNDAEFEDHGVTYRFYKKGDAFMVSTEGPDGEMAEFEAAYTFGIEPLQQYLTKAASPTWQTSTEGGCFHNMFNVFLSHILKFI